MAKAKTKTGNPFLDADFPGAMDFTKLFGQFNLPSFNLPSFNLPNVDSDVLIESQRKNIEAVTKANQVAFAGTQMIVQRQAEILRQAMDEATRAVQEMTKPGKPADIWTSQTVLLKEAYELALANLRELTEIGAKWNGEAAEVLSHRISDGLDELKGAFKEEQAVAKDKPTAK
jgi:phasin family protein